MSKSDRTYVDDSARRKDLTPFEVGDELVVCQS